MLIGKFFENREVFITGASGFIGKALIEKLLRSCPGIGTVFVLIRAKREKSANERLVDILKTSLFNRLRSEQPHTLRKVVAIEGDCMELGLGINADDLQRLKNVSVIYNGAASVRFDDHLRDAILMNTRGTYELIKIAQTLKQLKAFVHVSTTYCNPDKRVIEEEVYPAYADWRITIKLAENYSTEMLNILSKKYLGVQPNTYTFTKSLAEHVVNDHRHNLPVVIFRPSIVVNAHEEPLPGWLDNFNGPVGLLLACGIGILRTNYSHPGSVLDVVPIDIVVKAMIIMAYKKAMAVQNDPQDDTKTEVVNCAVSSTVPLTLGGLIEIAKKCIKENPIEKTLWSPGGSMTQCPFWNYIKFMLLQVLTAVLVDGTLYFANKKTFLLKLQRRIYTANAAVYYFYTRTWLFKNANFFDLENKVPKAELDKFTFLNAVVNLDHHDLFRKGLKGGKEFLLNEPPVSSKNARIRFKIFEALDYFVKLISLLMITRFVLRTLYMKYVL